MQNHSRSVSGKHRRQAIVELSNHEVADETPKQKPWPNAETNVPPRLSAQIKEIEETTIAQKPSVAEDSDERNGLTEQEKQRESDGKRIIKVWAHGGDRSKADRAWAKRLTADHARVPCF